MTYNELLNKQLMGLKTDEGLYSEKTILSRNLNEEREGAITNVGERSSHCGLAI